MLTVNSANSATAPVSCDSTRTAKTMAERPDKSTEMEIRRFKVSVLVEPNFFQSDPTFAQTDLILSEVKLSYELNGNKGKELLLEDLIGAVVSPKPPVNNPLACQVIFKYYPKVKAVFSAKLKRKFLAMFVQFDSANTFRDNLYTAKEWEKAIIHQRQRALRKAFYPEDVLHSPSPEPVNGHDVTGEEGVSGESAMRDVDLNSRVAQRQFLVFINPVGGKREAQSCFQNRVLPLFKQANIECDIIITERQGHARDVVREYNVSKIDGIVLASGDGVLYEVVNGLMEREDWETAIKTPLGILPLGSGNALCASILHEAKEEFSLENAAFQIICGGVAPMDLATVQTSDDKKQYMCILSSWGLVADVDIESERWRSIGENRFILGTLNCIRKKILYRGRLQYLPVDEPAAEPAAEVRINGDEIRAQDQEEEVTEPEGDPNQQVTRQETPDETQMDLTPIDAPVKSKQMNRGPPTDLLPASLSDPIPSNWKTLEGEYVLVCVCMMSHMAHGVFSHPKTTIGTGMLHLSYATAMSRMRMVSMFKGTETGKHVEMEELNHMDVKACRIEPITEPGILTIDGEPVIYGPLQMQVHKHLGRVMRRKRRVDSAEQ